MLRVVLPVVATAGGPIRYVLPVGVVYVGVVPVDGDIVVAAPAVVVAPAAAPSRTHRNPNSKGNRHARGVIPSWRIGNGRIRIDRRTVHHSRVITRNVNHLWTGLLNHDDLLALDHLGFHFLLLSWFQVPGVFGLFAHPLSRVHNVTLLR